MTIKKKIRLSNILMVLIPIGVTALVFGICMQTFLGDYWHSLEVMYRDEKGIQSAQSLIYTYQRELWEVNWGDEVPTQAGEPIRQNEEMLHMEKKAFRHGIPHYGEKERQRGLHQYPGGGAEGGCRCHRGDPLVGKHHDGERGGYFHRQKYLRPRGKEFAVIAVNSQPGSRRWNPIFSLHSPICGELSCWYFFS